MYRLLEIGETIMDGDEWFSSNTNSWNRSSESLVGLKIPSDAEPYRRKIKENQEHFFCGDILEKLKESKYPKQSEETNTGNYTVNNYNKITVMGRIGNGDKEKSKWKLFSKEQPSEDGKYLILIAKYHPGLTQYIGNWQLGDFYQETHGMVTKNVIKWRKLPKVD